MHNIVRHIISFLLVTLPLTWVSSQVVLQPKQIDQDNKGIIYDKEWSTEFKLHTNGYGLGFNWGTIKSYYKTQTYSVHLDVIKHPAEYRQNRRPSFYNNAARPFVFGKQNSFFSLKGSIGNKIYLSEKAPRKGLAVGFSYQGGLSLGFIKPVYIEVIESDDQPGIQLVEIKYTESTADQFLTLDRISSGAGFFKGLDETKIVPGLQGRAAVHFAWGAFDEYVKALDIGIMAELYPREIPIMVIADNSPYFINLYINLQFGRRL